MEIPKLDYQNETWDVNLPSIRAYTFSKKEIDSFIEKGEFPLDFDTNLVGGCNTDCKYCATQGGKTDVRFNSSVNFPILTDENLSEIINQLDSIGTKTFFLCGNGEPLLNPRRFLNILDCANKTSINIVTYTNGTTLDRKFLKELHKREVNLVMKLESLNPVLNDKIIQGKNNSKRFKGYEYGSFQDQIVPKGIIEAFDVYGVDSDCLGLETMILSDNIEELLSIREWAYNLEVSQFLKHLYPLGYVQIRGGEVMPEQKKEIKLKRDIIDFDLKYGFKYPSHDTSDSFSYDSRRFMNNCISSLGFPFRMFAHEVGGVYHSSQSVPIKFGFGTDKKISVFGSNGNINMKNYFRKIGNALKNE